MNASQNSISKNSPEKAWLTTGIRISLIKKKDLSRQVKFSNNENFIKYYKNYIKILKKVIKCSKKTCNDKVISRAKNKARATWGIIRKESGKQTVKHNIEKIKVNGQ